MRDAFRKQRKRKQLRYVYGVFKYMAPHAFYRTSIHGRWRVLPKTLGGSGSAHPNAFGKGGGAPKNFGSTNKLLYMFVLENVYHVIRFTYD